MPTTNLTVGENKGNEDENVRNNDDTINETIIKNWRRQRGSLRGRVTVMFNRFVSVLTIQQRSELTMIKSQLCELDECIFDACECSEEDRLVSERYGNLIRHMLLAKEVTESTISTTNPPISSPLHSVLLHNKHLFKIQQFDGKHVSFSPFFSQFIKQIDSNTSLAVEDKFRALKNLMSENVKGLFRGLNDDEAGYTKAKKRLQDRFEDVYKCRQYTIESINRLKIVEDEADLENLKNVLHTSEEGLQLLIQQQAEVSFIDLTFQQAIAEKLPNSMITKFTALDTKRQPTEKLIEFIERSIRTAELARDMKKSLAISTKRPTHPKLFREKVSVSSAKHVVNQAAFSKPCIICQQEHMAVYCKSKTTQERLRIVKQKKLCVRCFEPNHPIEQCLSKYQCGFCSQPHSKSLCLQSTQRQSQTIPKQLVESDERSVAEPSLNESATEATTSINVTTGSCTNDDSTTFYKTCLIKIKGKLVRVLIDCGAGKSFILKSLVNQLKLKQMSRTKLIVNGFGNSNLKSEATKRVYTEVKSVDSSFSTHMNFNVLDDFGNLSAAALPPDLRQYFASNGVVIQDVDQHELCYYPISVVIGLDYYNRIVESHEVKFSDDVVAKRSKFGWVVFGPINLNDNAFAETMGMSIFSEHVEENPMQCTNSWCDHELLSLTKQENKNNFVENFINTSVKYENNAYEVELPWLKEVTLVNNYQQALHRLNSLLRHLTKHQLLTTYTSAINEFIDLGFAEAVIENSSRRNRTFYMPHHPIIKEDRTTTKLRVVFDASAGKPSLNDNLYKGEVNYNVVDTLLHFRLNKYAATADIEKAYLKVSVHPNDRDALRFLWINSDNKPCIYRMKVVPFGTTSSPFLLQAVLTSHFDRMTPANPNLINFIRNKFYVDDLVISVATQEELETIKHGTTELMTSANMVIRKWTTNHKALNDQWAENSSDIAKILGIQWHTTTDLINVCFKPEIPSNLTKRQLSELIGKIYDPLGLLVPIIVPLRVALRECWKQKVDWDENISESILSSIQHQLSQLHLIPTIKFNRSYFNDKSDYHMHVFCDASKTAYGIVCYLVSPALQQTALILAKSRLSPEDSTIPELELKAIYLAAKIVPHLRAILSPSSVVVWSDSQINTQRLSNHPNKYKPHIAEKLIFINDKLKAPIYHIAGKLNPADLTSRGCSVTQLATNQLWTHGPDNMLHLHDPTLNHQLNLSELNTSIAVASHQPSVNVIDFERGIGSIMNKYWRLYQQLRAAENIKRCLNLLLTRFKVTRIVSCTPIQLVIRASQRLHFHNEIRAIELNKPVSVHSVLHNYALFIDELGILRLRTRLENSKDLNFEQVNPIIISHQSSTGWALIKFHHLRDGHAGVSRTNVSVREEYFIPKIRQLARKVISRCFTCQRLSKQTIEVPFGAAPPSRVSKPARAFECIGIDLFGPLKTKDSSTKWHGIIFVCTTTRAIHLEIIQGQTTSACFSAFRRFVARRGVPAIIHSDNGTNLIKLDKTLKKLYESIRDWPSATVQFNIKWMFQTPASPWRGGFFERLIQIVKTSLNRITFPTVPKLAELNTLLTEIEAIVNSRPLFATDSETITPAHFFIGAPLTKLPPVDYKMDFSNQSILGIYRSQQGKLNAFWTYWVKHYLLQLRNWHQNSSKYQELKIGDVVMVSKSNVVRNDWPWGRIVNTMPGSDNKTRTYEIELSNGSILTRSAQSLVLMELSPPGNV